MRDDDVLQLPDWDSRLDVEYIELNKGGKLLQTRQKSQSGESESEREKKD